MKLTREQHCTHLNQVWCDCDWCRYIRANQRKNEARKAKDRVYRDLGMVKVRGALGGTYYE